MTADVGLGVEPTLDDLAATWSRRRVIGVEREYTVLRDGEPVDARTLLPTLDLGVALDPGDPRARRGRWGGVVTADGRHGEVATPPVPLGPGCTRDILALAAAGADHLRDRLPRGHALVGYSTHVSVEVDDRRVVRVADLVARRLAVPLMLALDRRGSPGLLVRPRPGRLEIGGEFAAGAQLRAAVALTIGITLLAERRCRILGGLSPLPRTPRVRPERAVERFGWYVDRRAHGPDLYADARATRLGATTAADVLDRAWRAARPLALTVLDAAEVALADGVVAGAHPLPLERPVDDDGWTAPVRTDRHYGPRRCGRLEIHVTAATWWKALLEVRDEGRRRWLTIPGRALDDLLDALDRGAFDDDALARELGLLAGGGARA